MRYHPGMPCRAPLLASITLGAVTAIACSTPLDVFRCETNADCRSADKSGEQCEPTNLCSFFDRSCEGEEQRYGTGAGELSNQCVGGDEADASTTAPRIDASTPTPTIDASTQLPTVDASTSPIDATPSSPDADLTCANISLTVHDNNIANDFLKIRIAGNNVHYCQADPVAAGADTVMTCDFCITLGTAIQVSWFEGDGRITEFTTDCNDPCPILNEFSCDFTVTEACSATVHYDIDFP